MWPLLKAAVQLSVISTVTETCQQLSGDKKVPKCRIKGV